MASAAYYVPLDVFNSHKPTLISELEDPVESVAGYCRDANIIDSQFHDELVLVTGKKHKAEKLVNAISDRIRDQSAQVEQEQCVLRRFIGALRRESSCESMVIQLEKSLSREDVAAVAQESTSLKDPLNEYISKDHQRKIGKEMKYWKKWANALNLTGGQMTGIDDDKSLDYDMKGGKVLELWAKKYKATYRILCEVALKLEDRAMARIVCTMVNGNWGSICPEETHVSELVLPVESTEDVKKTLYQPTTQICVSEQESGLRQRRIDTPAILTDAISKLYDARTQARSDQSSISSLEGQCLSLQKQLCDATEDMKQLSEELKSKDRELSDLFYQKSMMERSQKSQVDGLQSQVEDLKLADLELREKIIKCKEEKQSLIEELEAHVIKEESLMQEIKELNERVDYMLREQEGWFVYVRLICGKMNNAMSTFFVICICAIVCMGVFIVVLLVVLFFLSVSAHPLSCPNENYM